MTWQLQEAKTRFSEMIEQAHVSGPQIITRHGSERAVVLSVADYRALTAHKVARKPNPIDYLLDGPRFEDFEIEPSHDTGREIDL